MMRKIRGYERGMKEVEEEETEKGREAILKAR